MPRFANRVRSGLLTVLRKARSSLAYHWGREPWAHDRSMDPAEVNWDLYFGRDTPRPK